jgi:hypothetical protein
MLHGAGGRAINALSIVRAEAQRRGVIVVAPKSSSASWDVLRGGFGPDVATIDQALENAFTYHAVDTRHLADFLAAYNFARRLKTLKGLTPYEFICKPWTIEPKRFKLQPIHQMPGLNT